MDEAQNPTATFLPDNTPDNLPEDTLSSYFGVTNPTAYVSPTSPGATVSIWNLDFEKPAEESASKILGSLNSECGYIPVERIARGGMGEIWEARQVSLDRSVAIKRIRPSRLGHPGSGAESESISEFRSEALITAKLEHPNIIPVHDLGEDSDGNPILAMKLVHGESWSDMLRRDLESKTETEILSTHLPILISVAQSVAFAHHRGIIHRDLKPSQVMIGEFGEVLLMDWGLAICLNEDQSEDGNHHNLPTLKSASNPAGTPAYMAPEQTSDNPEELGKWTDIYLLGGMLYTLLTTTPPHQARSSNLAFAQAAQGHLHTPAQRSPERFIPEDLAEVCMAAMATDVADRTATVTEFIDHIKSHVAGEGRKEDSRRLTTEVAALLDDKRPSYELFNQCLSKLDDANTLWSQNPQLRKLRDKCHNSYCQFSLDHKDFGLARMQAQGISLPEDRSRLLLVVERLEKARTRRELQRKLSIAAVFALLVTLLVSAVYFVESLSDSNAAILVEQQAAEKARSIAETQKDSMGARASASQDLLRFLIENQGAELDLTDEKHRAIMASTATEIIRYFNSIDISKDDREIQEDHVDRLIEMGRSFLNYEQYERAQELADLALANAELYLPKDTPLYPKAEVLLASAIRSTGSEGAVEIADRHYHNALARFEELGLEDTHAYYVARLDLSMTDIKAGRIDTAQESLLELEEASEREGNSEFSDSLKSSLYTNLGAVYNDLGDTELTLEYLSKSLEIDRRLHGPDSLTVIIAEANLGAGYTMAERYEEALALLEDALVKSREQLPPGSELEIVTLNSLAAAYGGLGELERALEVRNSVIEFTSQMYGSPHHPELYPMTLNKIKDLVMLGRYEEADAVTDEMKLMLPADISEAPARWSEYYRCKAMISSFLGNGDLVVEYILAKEELAEEFYKDDSLWMARFYVQTVQPLERTEQYALELENIRKSITYRLLYDTPEFLSSAKLHGFYGRALTKLAIDADPEERRLLLEELLAMVAKAESFEALDPVIQEGWRLAVDELGTEVPPRTLDEIYGVADE